MHRVRDLDPSCGHVQISSVATWGGTWHAAGHVATHEDKCTAAPCLCSLSVCDRQLTSAIWNLFSLQNITSDGCAESWASEKPIVYTVARPLLLLLMTLWWGWSDDRWLCITPDQCSGRVTSLFLSTVKDRGLSTCTLFLRWILFLMLCLSCIRIFNSY